MREILNLRVLIAALVIGFLLTCGSMIYILAVRPASLPDLGPLAALTRIPGPTATPYVFTATPSPPSAAPLPSTTSLPGQFAVGVYVQISGTEGQGLRIRSEPGLNATQLFLGYDAEVFQIADGPRETDGYTWWYLTASYDTTRSGWAVQNYLSVIDSP
ncbi:MAG: SH3 domain-containing protein [Anaerolineales bacterium]|nr:SH3 domain-containing protein [Anaerolineales bacterium]